MRREKIVFCLKMLWSYIDKTDKFSKVVIHRSYPIKSVAFLYANDDFVRKGSQELNSSNWLQKETVRNKFDQRRERSS